MRDRLIELINEEIAVTSHDNGEFVETEVNVREIADHLLAEGVIVPPCKVWDRVYFADNENKSVWEGHIVSFSLDAAHLWFNCHYKCGLNIWHPIEDFGATVFLTKEEATRAMAERREG